MSRLAPNTSADQDPAPYNASTNAARGSMSTRALLFGQNRASVLALAASGRLDAGVLGLVHAVSIGSRFAAPAAISLILPLPAPSGSRAGITASGVRQPGAVVCTSLLHSLCRGCPA